MELIIVELGYKLAKILELHKVDLLKDLALNFAIKELTGIAEEKNNFKVNFNRQVIMEPRVLSRPYIKAIKQDFEKIMMDSYNLEPFVMDIKVKLAVTKFEESEIANVGVMAIVDMGFMQGFSRRVNFNIAELDDFKSLTEFNFTLATVFIFKIIQLVCKALPILI